MSNMLSEIPWFGWVIIICLAPYLLLTCLGILQLFFDNFFRDLLGVVTFISIIYFVLSIIIPIIIFYQKGFFEGLITFFAMLITALLMIILTKNNKVKNIIFFKHKQ